MGDIADAVTPGAIVCNLIFVAIYQYKTYFFHKWRLRYCFIYSDIRISWFWTCVLRIRLWTIKISGDIIMQLGNDEEYSYCI